MDKNILIEIVRNYPFIWENEKRLRALLSDYMPEEKLYRNLIAMCVEERIPHDIDKEATMTNALVFKWEQRLISACGCSDALAKTVVAAWIEALGKSGAHTDVAQGREIKIEDLGLSVRSYNCLRRAGYVSLEDFADVTISDLMGIRNLGRKSLEEILSILKKHGIDIKEVVDEPPAHRPSVKKQSQPTDIDDFIYVVNGNKACIRGYNGNKLDLVIPDEIQGAKVTLITEKAFEKNMAIRSVTLPQYIEQIEEHAFYECKNLKKVVFPNRKLPSLRLGPSIFGFCELAFPIVIKASSLILEKSALGYIYGVEQMYLLADEISFGDYSVCSGRNLKKIVMYPQARISFKRHFLNSTEGDVFKDNGQLTEIYMPDDCPFLCANTFKGTPNVQVFANPQSNVISKAQAVWIPVNTAEYKHGLERIERELKQQGISPDITWSYVRNDQVTKKAVSDFKYVKNGNKVCIRGYMGADSHLVIPDEIDGARVTLISEKAFEKNQNLQSVVLPRYIEQIDEHAFYECKKLRKVSFPSQKLSHLKIGPSIFGFCEIQEPIIITAASLELDKSALGYIYGVRELYLLADEIVFGDYSVCSGRNLEKIVMYPHAKVSFKRHFLNSTDGDVFKDNKQLNEIYMPNECSFLCSNTFRGAAKVHVYANEGAPVIEKANACWLPVHSDTYRERLLKIQAVVNGMGYTFETDWNMVKSGHRTANEAPDFDYVIRGKEACIRGYSGSESNVVIPDAINGARVTVINEKAFENNLTIRRVQLPKYIYKIDEHAFYECKNLKEIIFPDRKLENLYIGASAFGFCNVESPIVIKAKKLELDKSALGYIYAVRKISLLADIIVFGDGALCSCRDVQTVEMFAHAQISFKRHYLNSTDGDVFKDMKNLEKIYMPDDCPFMNKNTFKGSSKVVVYTSSERTNTKRLATEIWIPVNTSDYPKRLL